MSISKPKILFLTHQYDNLGGVEEHLKSLEKHLSEKYEFAIIYPDEKHLILRQTGKDTFYLPAHKRTEIDPIRASQTEISLDLALQVVKPDLIHIVHLCFWPASAALLCLQSRTPVVTSFHDYFLLTPEFTMQGASTSEEVLTKEYSEKTFGADISEFLAARREFYKSLIPNFSARIVPSKYLDNLLSNTFSSSFEIIECGIENFTVSSKENSSIPRFGYLGSYLSQKGVEVLLESFEKVYKKHPKAELYMYGGDLDKEIPGVKSFGKYRRNDLGEIISNFDVGVIPSIFAETYCMTASELWHGKRTFIASKIGALADRVKHKENGFLVKPNSATDLAEAMNWFIENDEWKNWKLPSPSMARQMADKYNELYSHFVK